MEKARLVVMIMSVAAALLAIVALVALVMLTRRVGVQADMLPAETPSPAIIISPLPPIPTPEPEMQSPPPGYAVSLLTGLYIREEAAERRPFAVVYNNESRAMPQSGLMQADIIYEVLAEGSTTRIVAIFQDFDGSMIGPVRSTRQYFTYFALDHGAVMVHHGGSVSGYNAIRNRGIPAVDGMSFDGTVFWRYAPRRYRGLEHTSYTSAENLINIAGELNFDMTVPENLGLFQFFEEIAAPVPENLAHTVTVPLHNHNITTFEYNPNTNLYYKSIFGGPQMDDAVDAQMAVTNVLVQITSMSVIDNEGRRAVTMVGSGHGYLATHGTYSPVTWERASAAEPTKWYDTDGQPLTVNVGRTWISVINNQPTFVGPAEDMDEGEIDDE